MKTYHVQVELTRGSGILYVQWFGPSAIYAAGSTEYTLSPGANAALVPEPCLIDLQPLLAEIAAGTISDAEEFQAADEFLMLRDLLADEDFQQLCETLYHFLWREAQQGLTLKAAQRGTDGKVWIDPDRRLVRVWFATDRKPVQCDDIVERFCSEESADCITYGVCNVFIPESHKPGSTGTAWWRRWIRLEADDSLKVHGIHSLPRDVFLSGLANKLQSWWAPGQRNLFVLIHGFNVSFEEAAIRAAQIGYDLKIPGEMAFYSWPSRGSATAYSADEATITASVPHIAQFLHELSERSGAERIHLFVHSMGNRGLLSALERLVARGYPQLNLGQVFFCAPDEDVRTFKDKTGGFPHQCENRTLLVSPQDNAVFLSQWKHQYTRVGYVPPVMVFDGIETIEIGGFPLLDLGHGYFASAGPVIEDIREAIETQKPTSERTIPRALEKHFAIDIRRAVGGRA
jgi:esterase/lipase superfamily enzyme